MVLAAVNHPNIASVHGFEEGNGICAVVLELIDGETLGKHMARGPLPVVREYGRFHLKKE